jgi:hypothetical protein
MPARWMLMVAPLALSACATMAQEEVPAVLVDSSANAQLVSVVGQALGHRDVAIAPDALMQKSTLLVERTPARDATGQRLSGRDYGRPESFQLLKRGDACVLVHESTQKRYELNGVRCVEKKVE